MRSYAWGLGLVALGFLVGLERRRPLRVARQPRRTRIARNLAIAAVGGLTVQILERPLVDPLARRVAARRWGLLPRLGLSPVATDAAAVVLLDLTLYGWHVLTHRVPILWRFHRVHHADPDLDTSTAVRFHFGELALSVPFRVAQVLAIGVSPRALAAWRRALFASILFHHSNLRLPERLDAALSWIVTTPRLHGIHHSVRAEERNSNWSSGLAIWDRLFGTFRDDAPQETVAIGLERYADDGSAPRALALPFRPSAVDVDE